jgi:hypothetical protein
LALGRRDRVEPVKHRGAQVVQRGERELHLRLDPRRAHYATVRRSPRQVLQQRGLSHTSIPAQHQRPARAPGAPPRRARPAHHAPRRGRPDARRAPGWGRRRLLHSPTLDSARRRRSVVELQPNANMPTRLPSRGACGRRDARRGGLLEGGRYRTNGATRTALCIPHASVRGARGGPGVEHRVGRPHEFLKTASDSAVPSDPA